jgi:hypothetical protein
MIVLIPNRLTVGDTPSFFLNSKPITLVGEGDCFILRQEI